MTGLSAILGIVLIALMLRKGKPLSGRGLILCLVCIALFYAASTALIARNAPNAATLAYAPDSATVAYLWGRAVGAYVLLLLFVAVGHVIRNRRAKPTT